MPPRGAGMQHAHCATGASCSGQRIMRWPAHLRGRHDQVCARRAGGHDSQYAAVLRELLRAGGGVARRYSRALPLTVCAFERRRKRGSRGRSGAKNGRTRVALPISSFSTIVQSNLISWSPASVDFTPESSLGSRQLGASMELDAGAARRLREALDILASGELPECPVCKPPRA